MYCDEVSLLIVISNGNGFTLSFVLHSYQDGGYKSIGEVVSVPINNELTPGKVWVQWPHEKEKSYSYREGVSSMGFNGKSKFLEKCDLQMFKAATCGHYQPDILPILKISTQRTDEKPNDSVVPLVNGDLGFEELREMMVVCGLQWNADTMKEVMHFVNWRCQG